MDITFALGRTLLLVAALLAVPPPSIAANGDCGQPFSTGATPNTSDTLCCLKRAVGIPCGARSCICDFNWDGFVRVGDVLAHLRFIVGGPENMHGDLSCRCPDDGLACTSARITMLPGSTIDQGWTGIAHESQLAAGATFDVHVLKRCSDTQAPCTKNGDCSSRNCVATCDCVSDTTCEVTGPSGDRRCSTTLSKCSTNVDCPPGAACIDPAGPPLPLSSGGTPTCVLAIFDQPLSGTTNPAIGDLALSTTLKTRVFLGLASDIPCPRCGAPDHFPKEGDTFTCEGGMSAGAACTVDAVTPLFGGTSYDCPPSLSSNIAGAGTALRLGDLTTGTITRTARLPCASLQFRGNPLNAPTSPGRCLDNNTACNSNADCTRCSGDPSTACSSNADCSGKGSCAEAPDQPVSCGYWCSCGFCDGEASLPCFEDSECPLGQACQAGTGTATKPNAPQQKPNDCSLDAFICGQKAEELCATTKSGHCALKPWMACATQSDPCPENAAGPCVLQPRACFGPRITRSGDPSPLGGWCAGDPVQSCVSNADCRRCNGDPEQACSANADCGETGPCGPSNCMFDSARPEVVALACVPATSSSAVNNVQGFTGPAALRARALVRFCRCGDSALGCDEQCDDGNAVAGDGCDENCRLE